MEEDDTSDKKQHEHRPNEARYHESDIDGATCSHHVGPDMKKRRIQMDSQQCLAHSRTNSGALPLTNPVVIKTSSKNVNQGLHPRQPKQKPRTTQMPSQGDIVHQNASTNDSFPMPKVQRCSRKSVKRNLMKDTNNISDTHNGNVFDKEGTNVAIYANTSTAAKSDSLLDEFEKDTMFDTAEVLNLVEKAESDTSSPCKSVQVGNWGTPFKSLQDEFENDTTFDTTEVLNLVEKAESDTSSPCKKLQGGKWGTPVKSLQDEFETDATFDTAEVLNLVEKAESDTSSPCTSKQGRSWDSPSKSSQDSPAPRDPIVISDDNVDMFSRLPWK
ncbi:uncharacterized protein [Amphiura filiformis]|uniref:uncharacterized protein n=1 Tax=Amphiura filiformis TaxID=82378 RepID=UPI003B221D37